MAGKKGLSMKTKNKILDKIVKIKGENKVILNDDIVISQREWVGLSISWEEAYYNNDKIVHQTAYFEEDIHDRIKTYHIYKNDITQYMVIDSKHVIKEA